MDDCDTIVYYKLRQVDYDGNYKEAIITKDKFIKEFSFDKDEENGQDKHFNTLERKMYSIDGLEMSPQFLDN